MANSPKPASLSGGIVDAHVHYWDPSLLHYDWMELFPAMKSPFLPEGYAEAAAGSGVSKILFVECGCDPASSLAESDWVASLAVREPRIAGLVAHASLEEGASVRAFLAQLASRPLARGVRRNLQWEEEEFCLRPPFVEGTARLEEFGFTMDLCIRHQQVRAVTELARRVPGVHFILDHFGKPAVKAGITDPWRDDLRELAALPNVSCKVSGLTTEADLEHWTPADLKPYVDAVAECFGPGRMIYGGDWPVCTLATDYGRWVETVAALTSSFTPEESDLLFRANAERIYRL